MRWVDLEPGDVILINMTSQRALLVLKKSQEDLLVELDMLSLTTSTRWTHARTLHESVANKYTVLRGNDVVQQGHHD